MKSKSTTPDTMNFLREWKGYKIYDKVSDDGSLTEKKAVVFSPADDHLTTPLFYFFYSTEEPASLNKSIEQCKSWIDNLKRCRSCGCTEHDCRQCIEKTGLPCTWVEDDLCSACKVEPVVTVVDSRAASMPDENLLEDTAVPLEEEAGQQAQDLTADEPDFFRRLASLGGVDILIRIFQKNGKLTVSVKPGSIAGALPAITTKDPGDVTAEFFDAIMPIVMTAPPPLAQQEVFPENPAVAPIVRTSVTRVKKKVKKSAPTVKKTTDKKVAKSNIKKVSPPKKRSLKRLPPKKKPVVKEKIKTPKAKPAPKLPKVKAVKPEKPKVKPSLAPPVTEVSLFG